MRDRDILTILNRLLAVTPETSLTTPPLRRRELVAAVTEIKTLRERVVQLEEQLRSASAGSS